MRDVQPIMAEIEALARARRQRVGRGTADDAAPAPLAPVDLRQPVSIPGGHPLGRLLALADRLRRRVLQAVLIRQSDFNQQASAAVAGLAARLEIAERDREELRDTVERLEARIRMLERDGSRALPEDTLD